MPDIKNKVDMATEAFAEGTFDNLENLKPVATIATRQGVKRGENSYHTACYGYRDKLGDCE